MVPDEDKTSLVSLRDMNDCKKAEGALRGSEEECGTLLNLGTKIKGAIVIVQDTEHGEAIQTFVSDMWAHMTGYSREELLGMSFFDLLHPKDYESSIRRHRRKMNGEIIPALFEIAIIRKDGTEVPIELTSCLTTYNGAPGNVAFVWDITERKRAEEEVRKSEEKYHSLFQNMLEGFAYCKILVDEDNQPTDFVHLEVNDAWERLIGLKREDVVGKKVTEAIPGIKESSTDLISIYGKVALTSEATEFDLYFESLGKWFTSSVYSPQKGYFVAVFHDITEQKQAEEREKQLQEELYLSSRLAAFSELAAGVAHEINNPLTGILGFSHRLLRKSNDETLNRDLERIHTQALRASNVVQNLMAFARRREPKKECVDVNDVLGRALELRVYELRTGNIELVVELAPSLLTIMADYGQIQEVFLNIVLNAEQAMTEEHGRGKLTVETQEIKGYIRISFDDDGPGIPAGELVKIFDPFFTTRGGRGGTGLGLSVCHGIVTEHGGRIYARSKPGKGATFFVELPVTITGVSGSNAVGG